MLGELENGGVMALAGQQLAIVCFWNSVIYNARIGINFKVLYLRMMSLFTVPEV